ncbi:hypothetical protein INT45_000051 [Circinella minor]|uniref:N-acetyltransferase domain-containing protein n=1 Tax=Circinella minor TaxID=1195481 RepID=A0A8H7VG52_9FUNG|nr:hypothetical protein INT45_000051 [Circinella minor]
MLSVIRYQDPNTFLNEIKKTFEGEENELNHMLFLWAVIRLTKEQKLINDHSYCGAVWRIGENDKNKKSLVFAMVMREHDSLRFTSLFTEEIETEGRKSITLLMNDIQTVSLTNKNMITSIEGKDSIIQLVREIWDQQQFKYNNNNKRPQQVTFDLNSSFHTWCYTVRRDDVDALSKKSIQKQQEGYFLRQATIIELPLLIDWLTDYFHHYKDYLSSKHLAQIIDQLVFTKITTELPLGNIYFYCDPNDLPVSMIWKFIPLEIGTSLGYVYTPSEKRNKGLGSAMVGAFSLKLLEIYKYINITVDGKQDPDDNMYTRLGYHFEGKEFCYKIVLE